MLPPVLFALLVLLLPLPAYASDASELRFTDIMTWATLVGLVGLVVAAWARAREWADTNLLTSLDLVRRTASPPRLRVWGIAPRPPALYNEHWLEAGRAHWVLGEPATSLPELVRQLLMTPGVTVAIHVDPRLHEEAGSLLPSGSERHLYVVQDLPTEQTLALLSLPSDLVVIILDRPIQDELRVALGRWGAVGISIGRDEGLAGGYAAVRSAP